MTVTGTLLAYGTNEPVEGATLTSDSCPGVVATTDPEGYVALEVATGAPYYPRAVADGFVTMRTGEQMLVADFDGGAPLFPVATTSLLPHWSEESPTILVIVFSDPIQGAYCDDLNGYTFAVTDHPEATVTYYSGTTIPAPDESLTATGPLGIAEIAGLDATAGGPLIELSAEKADCEVAFSSYPHTGRYVLEDGVLTVAGAYSPPRSAPD